MNVTEKAWCHIAQLYKCVESDRMSLMKDAGVPEAAVMELVGHDSEQMSAHCTHVGCDALERAAGALPDIA